MDPAQAPQVAQQAGQQVMQWWQIAAMLLGTFGIGTIVSSFIQGRNLKAIERERTASLKKLEEYRAEREFKTWLREKKMELYPLAIKALRFPTDEDNLSKPVFYKLMCDIELIGVPDDLLNRFNEFRFNPEIQNNEIEADAFAEKVVAALKEDFYSTK